MQKRIIKTHLQYPWKFPDSPYYKYLVESPPNNINYLNTKKQTGVILNKNFFWFSNFLKRNIRRFTKLFNLSIPNAHLSPNDNYDLIHCCHCLSKNINKPWVADIEMISSFAISGWDTKSGQDRIRKILMRDNCKKIMPWTKYVENEILKTYPELKNKIEVVYPAVPQIKNLKKPKNKKLKIIFVARYFDIKGGLIALEVLEELRKSHGITGIVVSNVPENIKKIYPNLEIHNLIPQKKLFKLMKDSDILLYPCSVDTFGFSLLEAMAFGLPIITINTCWTKSRREIVENEKNGYIFDVNEKLSFTQIGSCEKMVIKKLIENTEKLIKNKKLRERMGKNGLKEISSGKFSIKNRNKKLERIYMGAVK